MPETGAERAAIRDQIDRILASPLFRHSKRYPALFRYIVENTLEGRTERLKERTLGVEVFLRDPDYDTNLDPVVRTTAGEIRRRIAQYYHEPGHAGEIRIDLPSGSYVAEFRPPAAVEAAQPTEGPRVTRKTVFTACTVAAATAAAIVALWMAKRPADALELFWQPVWDSPGPALLCMGGSRTAAAITRLQELSNPADASSEISIAAMMKMDHVAFSDALTLSRLAGLLQDRKKPFRIQRGVATTFSDLRSGPAVLIGGFNNDWTLRLVQPLRFGLENDQNTHVHWIRDRRDPSNRRWGIDTNRSYLKLDEDYALISRIWDPTTERVVVIAAGINNYGTIAAGEFLTTPDYIASIRKFAPRDWAQKNIQLVIATEVINGNSGPPRIVAAHFW